MWEFIKSEITQLQLIEILGLLLIFLSGFLSSRLLTKQEDRGMRLVMSFPLGFGIASLIMIIPEYLGFKISFPFILIMMLLTIVILSAFQFNGIFDSFRQLKANPFRRNGKGKTYFSLTHTVFSVIIIAILGFLFIKSIYWQPISWDVLTSFDLHAQAIHHEGTLMHSLVDDEENIGVGIAYTPLISLSYAYLYFFDFDYPKVFPPIILISFVALFYLIMRRYTNKIWSVIITLIFLITPEFVSHGAVCQTNLALAFFGFASVVSLKLWTDDTSEYNYLYLSYLSAVMATWTRNEGIIVLGLVLLFSLAVSKKQRLKYANTFIAFALAFIPYLSWQIYRTMNSDLMDQYTQAGLSLSELTFYNQEKIDVLYKYTKKHILAVNTFGITFELLGFLLLGNIIWEFIQYRKLRQFKLHYSHAALIVLAFFWLGYLIILYELHFNREGTQADQMSQVANHSYKRFLFLIIPIAWFYIGNSKISLRVAQWINQFLYGKSISE